MRASISLLTPEKMITANVDSIPPGWRASKYMDFKTRKGKYRLNDKATERKLKKAANFHDIKIDDMKDDSSHSIQFSTGSYLTTVVPLLETFKGLVGTDVVSEGKNGEEIKIDVDKVEDKTDLSNTMVEHIIRLRVGGDDVVVTMYDTTLRMRIQGTGEQVKYTTQVLIPYLEDQVDKNTKASKEFNEMMIAYNFASQPPQASRELANQVEGTSAGPSTNPSFEFQHEEASRGLEAPDPSPSSTQVVGSLGLSLDAPIQVVGPLELSLDASCHALHPTLPAESSRGLEAKDPWPSAEPTSPPPLLNQLCPSLLLLSLCLMFFPQAGSQWVEAACPPLLSLLSSKVPKTQRKTLTRTTCKLTRLKLTK